MRRLFGVFATRSITRPLSLRRLTVCVTAQGSGGEVNWIPGYAVPTPEPSALPVIAICLAGVIFSRKATEPRKEVVQPGISRRTHGVGIYCAPIATVTWLEVSIPPELICKGTTPETPLGTVTLI
jgi:hypothetical protein